MKTIYVTCSIEVTGDRPDELSIRNAIERELTITEGCSRAYVKIIDVDREDGHGPVSRG